MGEGGKRIKERRSLERREVRGGVGLKVGGGMEEGKEKGKGKRRAEGGG